MIIQFELKYEHSIYTDLWTFNLNRYMNNQFEQKNERSI